MKFVMCICARLRRSMHELGTSLPFDVHMEALVGLVYAQFIHLAPSEARCEV